MLHLIARYEKARSSLDVMPDTLGVTANQDETGLSLSRRVSETTRDLFDTGSEAIRSLDRSVRDESPETIGTLMREIDRAFDAFDLMAVSHGWHGVRGINAETEQLDLSRRMVSGARDLACFVGEVLAAEIGQPAITANALRLPSAWARDMLGLPGFDSARSILHFTSDPETFGDLSGNTVGYLGRAHPLVLRAISHGSRLAGSGFRGAGRPSQSSADV